MKTIRVTLDERLLQRLDGDPEVKRDGRSLVLRRAASEYLRRNRRSVIAEAYHRAYGNKGAPELDSWADEESWRPITDFKAKGCAVVDQARRTRTPVLVTKRGRGVAVVVALDEFERMREELAFGRAVDAGAEQARRGVFASNVEMSAILGKKRR
jgi:prevent-host-death family protein